MAANLPGLPSAQSLGAFRSSVTRIARDDVSVPYDNDVATIIRRFPTSMVFTEARGLWCQIVTVHVPRTIRTASHLIRAASHSPRISFPELCTGEWEAARIKCEAVLMVLGTCTVTI
jgi:hypothetical protein